MEFLPYVSIRPHFLCLFSRAENPKIRSENQVSNQINLINHNPAGEISKKAARRIRNSIEWLLAITPQKKFYAPKWHKWYKFKVNFVTLTLSSKQIHSDNEIKKKLLNQFLIELKSKWNVKYYLWRAESQRNGNIHFHLCTNKYIPWLELRNNWNRIQNKLGYVDRFHDSHRHRSPNSTDVHVTKRIKNLPAYLAKYCTKESTERKITGKLWGLSTNLSKLKSSIHMLYSTLFDEIDIIKKKFKKHVKTFDYAEIIYVRYSQWKNITKGELSRLYNEFLLQARGSPETRPTIFC